MAKAENTDVVVADTKLDNPTLSHKELREELRAHVESIGVILERTQADNLRALWDVGRLIVEARDNPETYLTDEQIAAHIDAEAVIVSIFAPVYTAEQLRGAVNIFEAYPSERELKRLISLRCPARPRWRITASHAQLLAQIPDDSQRAAVEVRCVEEAYNARALALELRELRGKKAESSPGRPHESPKGIKNQLADLLQHQRRFITRSENLWLNEESDNIYDELANTSPSKITETICNYFEELEANFERLAELLDDHRAMCRKMRTRVFDKLDDAAEAETDSADDSIDEEVLEEIIDEGGNITPDTFSKSSRLTRRR